MFTLEKTKIFKVSASVQSRSNFLGYYTNLRPYTELLRVTLACQLPSQLVDWSYNDKIPKQQCASTEVYGNEPTENQICKLFAFTGSNGYSGHVSDS